MSSSKKIFLALLAVAAVLGAIWYFNKKKVADTKAASAVVVKPATQSTIPIGGIEQPQSIADIGVTQRSAMNPDVSNYLS